MRRLLTISVALGLLLSLGSAVSAQGKSINFKQINAQELKHELDSGAKIVVVDARTAQEYSQGHIPGAINITPKQFTFIAGFLPQDKTYPLVFYCRGVG